MSLVVHNIADLATLAPLAQERRTTGITAADLGRLGPGAWLAAGPDGAVEATGVGPVPAAFQAYRRCDAAGGLVLPGLVDSHAHPLFAGARAAEFSMRANGATYQEIAARGGGIQESMRATRAAGDDELLGLLAARWARSLRLGITTLEAKSGYGLSVPEELRHLRLLARARAEAPQRVAVTCLALHARSPEHASLSDYVRACAAELLPAVAAEGLAEAVDAFVEAGYFAVSDVEPYAAAARTLGLGLRLHADEFSDAGGAAAAAAWGAQSADHLQHASAAGVRAMAAAGVTATLLPGTSLYTRLPFADARRFADAGVAVALATDFNPGSCLIDNLAMLATVAAVHSGMRPAEALAAVTWVPASSLGLGAVKGALAAGMDADFLVYPLSSVEAWLADFGRTEPRDVWIQGVRRLG